MNGWFTESYIEDLNQPGHRRCGVPFRIEVHSFWASAQVALHEAVVIDGGLCEACFVCSWPSASDRFPIAPLPLFEEPGAPGRTLLVTWSNGQS